MITAITAVINATSSVVMIVLVLLHSGKGGGLSDMFGGGMGAAAQGSTVVEKNLDRITVVASVIFGFTTLALGGTLPNLVEPLTALLLMGTVLFGIAVVLFSRNGIMQK